MQYVDFLKKIRPAKTKQNKKQTNKRTVMVLQKLVAGDLSQDTKGKGYNCLKHKNLLRKK